MPANNNQIEKRLWSAADELRANSKMRAADYSIPVLGLIFLRYADFKFAHAEKQLAVERGETTRRRGISKIDYQARGVMYIPDEARCVGDSFRGGLWRDRLLANRLLGLLARIGLLLFRLWIGRLRIGLSVKHHGHDSMGR